MESIIPFCGMSTTIVQSAHQKCLEFYKFIPIILKRLSNASYLFEEKSMGVCETLQYAPGGNKVEKAIFSLKVNVNVTRSLTLV